MTDTYDRPGRTVTAGVLLALLAGSLMIGGCPSDATTLGRTAKVTRGEIEVVIRSKGALQAKEFTRIHSEIEMEAKITFLAEEGEMVKAGDVLVKLDPTDLEKRIDDRKTALDQALVQLDAAVSEVQIQETDNKNKLDRSRLTLKQAQQELEKYKQGDAPIEKRRLEIRLEETASDLKRKQEKYAQMPQLLEEGFVTAAQVEEERINVEKAKVDWETAQKELEVFKSYRHPMELERKKSGVTQAESDLEAVKKRNTSQLKQRIITRQGHETRVRTLKEKIADLESKLQKTVIPAPTGGLVIYGEPEERHRHRRSGNEIQVGTRVWPQNTIITLPDLSEMLVSFRIHESDISKIRLGLEGLVTVESFGKKTFRGRITRIAKLANAGGWRSDPEVKEFDVEMLLAGKNIGLMPGVSAHVELVTARAENVLRIPVTAIHGRPGAYHCFVETASTQERREVVLGLVSDSLAEVKSGLSEGETVVLGPPPDLGGEAEKEGTKDGAKGMPPAGAGKAPQGKGKGREHRGTKGRPSGEKGGAEGRPGGEKGGAGKTGAKQATPGAKHSGGKGWQRKQ
ncbi:MAG: efflux RND transporter periplasmic adaptor subunit [Planctomycetota bacterium]|jgi:HlyD family secretion protein